MLLITFGMILVSWFKRLYWTVVDSPLTFFCLLSRFSNFLIRVFVLGVVSQELYLQKVHHIKACATHSCHISCPDLPFSCNQCRRNRWQQAGGVTSCPLFDRLSSPQVWIMSQYFSFTLHPHYIRKKGNRWLHQSVKLIPLQEVARHKLRNVG